VRRLPLSALGSSKHELQLVKSKALRLEPE